ncbi:MAG: aryl-sulfate sulfotransferase, partial [Actinomycetota bacterium]
MHPFARRRLPSARHLIVGACALSLVAGCVANADGTAEQPTIDETGSSAPSSSSSATPPPSSTSATTPPSSSPTLADTVALEVAAQPVASNTLAAALTIDATMPVVVAVTATADDHVVTTPFTAAADASHLLPLVGLRSNREYVVEVVAFDTGGRPVADATTTVATGDLPDFVVDYELAIATSEMQPGLTLVEAVPSGSTGGHLLAVDSEGHVVWYHEPASTLGAVSINDVGNFTAVSFPFGYVEFDVLGATINDWVLGEPGSSGDGGTDVTTLDVPWSVGSNRSDAQVHTAHHDVIELPSGNLLGLARVTHDVSAELRAASCPNDDRDWSVASDVVVEFQPDGTVVRTWNVADAIDIETNPGTHLCSDGGLFATDLERDWSHANAVEYDAERDLVLVSIRHTDSIVAFEHPDDIGHHTEVAWILGAD